MRIHCWLFVLAAVLPVAAQVPQLQVPPSAPPPAYRPFLDVPPIALDEVNNGVGVAQQVAREKRAQARILWVDGLANVDRLNSAEKIDLLVKQVVGAGFTTVVLDVKPIHGMTLYPSKIAPRMTEWRGVKLPAEFDPLAELIRLARPAGVEVVANLNVFAEGHRMFSRGPGYDNPAWLTTLCEPQLVLAGANGATMPLAPRAAGQAAPNTIYVFTTLAELAPKPGMVIAVLDEARRALLVADGAAFPANAALPKGGTLLVAEGAAAEFLRRQVDVGAVAQINTVPTYVLSRDMAGAGVPLWTNPNSPAVQQRMLDIVTELVTTYPLDGVIFDDRLRYAAINADMGEASRKAFEAYVGRKLSWPDDVLKFDISYPAFTRRVSTGPQYDAWVLWRATTIRNWVAKAVNLVKIARPHATVSVYVGSWYGEYFAYGSNWAADDFQAGFRFLNDAFRQTGYAQLLDWMTTGCYYTTATVGEATASGGGNLGFNVEAAGQLSNRAANSAAWVYAGISLDRFDKNPEGLLRALQAATASTQGVMVFDLSHKIEQFWPVFKQAFRYPAKPPHAVPGLKEEVQKRVAERKKAGLTDPPVIIMNGAAGTGL